MGGMRAVALALLALLLLAGAGLFHNSPYTDVIGLAHALRSGDPEAALRWIHVPSLAASVVDILEETWIAPWRRPFFRAAFSLARPLVQRQVEEEIREMVRRIALGTPDAPVHLPRWGGLPLTAAAVLALVRFEALPEGRIRLSVLGPSPPMRLVLARVEGRWVIVAVDRTWFRDVLARGLAPQTR
jgi:hypothetical protein